MIKLSFWTNNFAVLVENNTVVCPHVNGYWTTERGKTITNLERNADQHFRTTEQPM